MRTHLNVVVAGHIDHGKTALVRALTGVDTDRLEEEKRRGMTIELGFAPLRFPDGRWISLIDVPGHERLVHTMIAGAVGGSAIMLVVAADEGVMPQTVEHAEVARLLGMHTGIIVLNKVDRTDDEWRALAREAVAEWCQRIGWAHMPIVEVSARTGEGLDALRAALQQLLDRVPPESTDTCGRLAVDRVFSRSGVGTIVTGTMTGRPWRIGTTVTILPERRTATIRSIQVHGAATEETVPGGRTALNLQGVHHTEIRRGDWLVDPGTCIVADAWYARVEWLRDVIPPECIRNGGRFHFHHGTAHQTVRLYRVHPRADADTYPQIVRIVMDHPCPAVVGDRFILRRLSPTRTVAGGRLLMPARPRKRVVERRLVHIWSETTDFSPAERITQWLRTMDRYGATLDELVMAMGWTTPHLRSRLRELAERAVVILDDPEHPQSVVAADAEQTSRADAMHALRTFLEAHPLQDGMPLTRWLRQWLPRVLPVWTRIVRNWAESGTIVIDGDRVRLPEVATNDVPPHWHTALADLERVIVAADYQGLKWQDLQERARRIGMPLHDLFAYLQRRIGAIRLQAEGVTHVVSGQQLDRFRDRLVRLAQHHPTITIADVKRATGWSRKWVIAWLELADRLQWTRREGNVRRVLIRNDVERKDAK